MRLSHSAVLVRVALTVATLAVPVFSFPHRREACTTYTGKIALSIGGYITAARVDAGVKTFIQGDATTAAVFQFIDCDDTPFDITYMADTAQDSRFLGGIIATFTDNASNVLGAILTEVPHVDYGTSILATSPWDWSGSGDVTESSIWTYNASTGVVSPIWFNADDNTATPMVAAISNLNLALNLYSDIKPLIITTSAEMAAYPVDFSQTIIFTYEALPDTSPTSSSSLSPSSSFSSPLPPSSSSSSSSPSPLSSSGKSWPTAIPPYGECGGIFLWRPEHCTTRSPEPTPWFPGWPWHI